MAHAVKIKAGLKIASSAQEITSIRTSVRDVASAENSALVSELGISAGIAAAVPSWYDYVIQMCEASIACNDPDVVLSDSDPSALQTAINALSEGQSLEIRTNASYTPVVIPSDRRLIVKTTPGYFPRITGANAIRLSNGSRDVFIAGLILEDVTTANPNYMGSAISFASQGCKVSNIIFFNLKIRNAGGSAVMLSYHGWTTPYYNPIQPAEMSEKVAFVDCYFHRGGNDGTEGANLSVRGINCFYAHGNRINGDGLSTRGIQIQTCTGILADENIIENIGGSNAEGIKIDSIGSPVAVSSRGIVYGNRVRKCVEGIDLDDLLNSSCVGNEVSECTGPGIILDDSSAALIVGNVCYKNAIGIRLEINSVAALKKNTCFSNTQNYRIDNGYVLDNSNSESIQSAGARSCASSINTSAVPGATVEDALNEVDSLLDNLEYIDDVDVVFVPPAGTYDRGGGTMGEHLAGIANAFKQPVVLKTADYTAADGELVLVDASAGNVKITLPAGQLIDGAAEMTIENQYKACRYWSARNNGMTVTVKRIDGSANTVTVAAENAGNTDNWYIV